MGRRSRRYKEAVEKAPDPREKVSIEEAVKTLKALPDPKFDATVELSMHLGIDPRQADQALRGGFSFPHGIGKTMRVIAFCEGDEAEQAKAAGAVEAGLDELVEKVQDGWTDFDVALAKPQTMKNVSRLGRVLGPQGLMPSPKAGTVTDDIVNAVKEFSAGKVEYRNDDGGNLHVPVGKKSFDEKQLIENIQAFIDLVKRLRPATVKRTYIQKVTISSTMSPSIQLDVVSQPKKQAS